MTNGNDPINANAFDPQIHARGGISHERIADISNGLTKREYFAAMAMQGIVSNHAMIDIVNWEWLSKESVKISDALIKALNDTP